MADKSSQLLLSALSRTIAQPTGLPLHGGKSTPGLFPNTVAGKQAAQRCVQDGWIRCTTPQTETTTESTSFEPHDSGLVATTTSKKAKATPELYVITEKGMAWLMSQASPREVLEDFVRVLEAQTQMGDLLILVHQMQASFDQLRTNAEKVLHFVQQPGALSLFKNSDESQPNYFWQPDANTNTSTTDDAVDWAALLLDHLSKWQGGAAEDCPLPELYRQINSWKPGMTVGRFHDALRQLYETNRVYLHPWTGPMYEIPEPSFALLVGHEVAYYASYRKN